MENKQKENREAQTNRIISRLLFTGICIFITLGTIYVIQNVEDKKTTNKQAIASINDWRNKQYKGMIKAANCTNIEIRIYNNITGPAEIITIRNPELIEFIDMEKQECILIIDLVRAKTKIKERKKKTK